MPKTKYPIFKCLHRGEKGFTLIELLIVIAILGIVAAVVVPNVGRFFGKGTLQAANTEAATVKTAAWSYVAEVGSWTIKDAYVGSGRDTSGAVGDGIIAYIDGSLKAKYTFAASGTGCIIASADATGGWGTGVGTWNTGTCEWNPPA